jgi:excisionase family DNA binding protein
VTIDHYDRTSEVKCMKREGQTSQPETLLTPAEVAALFRVDPKTVTRWAKAGKLSSIRTLGGHRRYRETEVRQLLRGVEAGS